MRKALEDGRIAADERRAGDVSRRDRRAPSLSRQAHRAEAIAERGPEPRRVAHEHDARATLDQPTERRCDALAEALAVVHHAPKIDEERLVVGSKLEDLGEAPNGGHWPRDPTSPQGVTV